MPKNKRYAELDAAITDDNLFKLIRQYVNRDRPPKFVDQLLLLRVAKSIDKLRHGNTAANMRLCRVLESIDNSLKIMASRGY